MEQPSKLRLAKETLAELSTDELARIVGATDATCATDLCNPCIVTWSCDDIKTLNCL